MNTGLRPIKMKIDGQEIRAMPKRNFAMSMAINKTTMMREVPTTIYQAAWEQNIKIPILCHREHMEPVAVCRLCCVDIGGGKLVPACQYPVSEGLDVKTHRTSE